MNWAQRGELTRQRRLLMLVIILAVKRVLNGSWFLTNRLLFIKFFSFFIWIIYLSEISLLMLLLLNKISTFPYSFRPFIYPIFFVFLHHHFLLITLLSYRFISLSTFSTIYYYLLINLIYEFNLLLLFFWHCF
jgi:hypothetical protein